MTIEKDSIGEVEKNYSEILVGKRLHILFHNDRAYFFAYDQPELVKLCHIAVDSAAEKTESETGDSMLILTSNGSEFRFWKYDTGAFGTYYVVHSIREAPSRVQKYILEKLSKKKIILTIAKINEATDAITENRKFRVSCFDYVNPDFFPKLLLVIDVNYAEVYYETGFTNPGSSSDAINVSYLKLLRDDITLTVRLRSDGDQIYYEFVGVDLVEK